MSKHFFCLVLALTIGCTSIETPPPGEFRGVWVATVNNIDFPSKPGLSTAEQQRELIAILDRVKELQLNAVIFQVRPAADALYESRLEPWSEYLTGEMGKPPDPFWDPLQFAVREAHRRGLQLHAWFNPFRARHPTGFSPIAETHISRARPALVRTYGTHLWLDPALPEVREHSLAVVADVVRRYDVDGVHIDDYFYPYPEKDASGVEIPFPDGGLSSDQRRANVNRFVEELYHRVKQIKPNVRVGISPFGIWRPGHPPGVTGFDAYERLYADAKLWLQQGWCDYFVPQLYWPTTETERSFPTLLEWWQQQNVRGVKLWPGIRLGREPQEEIDEQIRLARRARTGGYVFFSMRNLKK